LSCFIILVKVYFVQTACESNVSQRYKTVEYKLLKLVAGVSGDLKKIWSWLKLRLLPFICLWRIYYTIEINITTVKEIKLWYNWNATSNRKFEAKLQKIINVIIHEENTKKNHKRAVSLYVIEIPLIYIHNFDFLELHNVCFENYFANELTKIDSFWSNLQHSQCVLSDLKILGFASYLYYLIKLCCSCLYSTWRPVPVFSRRRRALNQSIMTKRRVSGWSRFDSRKLIGK
jgi:hypothetical protein